MTPIPFIPPENELDRLRLQWHELVVATTLVETQLNALKTSVDQGFTRLEQRIGAQEASFVTRKEFEPVRMIAYALVGFSLLVLAGLITGKIPPLG